MEQRTGKTAVVILDAARRYKLLAEIDAVLVLAPNGVQSNWVLREIPRHMPLDVSYKAAAWYAAATKKDREALEALLSPQAKELRILAMNWEALITEDGFTAARKFSERFSGRLMLVADESQRIKNPTAARTRAFLRLRRYTRARVIMTGTPILNSPWDAFAQFSFLDEGILRTTSFSAFRAEYAELEPPNSGLMRHIRQRIGPDKPLPQIVKRDGEGRPLWRNIPQLEALLAPHMFRVLRKDCLDLPEKIYTQRFFRMTPKQHETYILLRDELRIQLANGELTALSRIAAFTKLSQVTSGYVLPPGSNAPQRIMPAARNPKLAVLAEEIESTLDAGKQLIIWARFHIELQDIATLLRELDVKFVEYHGRSGGKTLRNAAIDSFQSGAVPVFLSQPRSGGVGLTLNAGKAQIYYSNSFALEDRLQSEDRTEGIGQTTAVDVLDILAEDSIDEVIVERLKSKVDLASAITGDARRAAELLK